MKSQIWHSLIRYRLPSVQFDITERVLILNSSVAILVIILIVYYVSQIIICKY